MPSSAVNRTSTCWPARWPGQPGTSKTIVLTRGVSARPRRAPRAARSISRVALFLPWLSVIVVAVRLPEAGLVGRLEQEAPYPLGALPEVVLRDEHARGAAVLGRERLAVVGEDHPRLAARDVLERQVGRVAAVRVLDHEVGCRLDSFEERVDRDASPDGVELRPLGHAVDVAGDLLARQGTELLPGPTAGLVQLADDREVPRLERRVRRRPGGEDGEVRSHVLAGWDTRGIHVRGATAPEPARDDGCHLVLLSYRGHPTR